ncbi:MAG: beta-galactosidase [Ruminiclostridium sp.]|nr:beta-galactosidase [Ruminiclostridium sp.]
MNKIDLSGKWQLYMDASCSSGLPAAYGDEITLPGTTAEARKGERNTERASGYLTDPYKFEGHAWFGRKIDICEEWSSRQLYLRLERTRMTSLYVDGEPCGECDSLCSPHIYKLPQLTEGIHRIDICVKNVGYPTKGGHMTSPDTQTNWNGITGAIELLIRPKVHIDDIAVLSKTDPKHVVFSCEAVDICEAHITVDGGKTVTMMLRKGSNKVIYTPDAELSMWDEFSPELHCLSIAVNGELQKVSFGIRKLATNGRKLLVNGRETFLRGKHDGMLFPLTGYAPTDVDSWLKVLQTAKNYGINHYRFHTCCPPDAAFTAADMLGIYMQPELPFWGTVPDELTDEQRYLIEEGSRILKEFGNHPSFFSMSLGNELWGNKDIMNDILARYRREDDRHLYLDGSNNFQFMPCALKNADILSGVRLSRERLYRGSYPMCDAPLGFIQTDAPNTAHSYDKIIVPDTLGEASEGGKIQIQYGTGVKEVEGDAAETFIPEIPVISHEIGQYEMYPDYSEIEKYTGVLKAENIALFREKAEQNGLLRYAEDHFKASGALAIDCYKREIEAALKSEELSGFQLLDIQDFTGQGTALVGILNSMMQSKGLITPEKWRQFCNSVVIMAEFDKFVFSSEEDIVFGVTLFCTDPSFRATRASYTIECDGSVELYGHIRIKHEKRVDRLGRITFRADDIMRPAVYKLTLSVEGTDICNTYEFSVFPDINITITENEIRTENKVVKIAHDRESTLNSLEKGIKVLYVPDSGDKLPGTYCTDMWCFPMFRSISESMGKPVPIGTLGLLIDESSETLGQFPCRSYTTPQWFDIVMHSHCEELDEPGITPIVQVIDHPDRAKMLGLLYNIRTGFGTLTVCTSRLWEIADKPEVRWFAKSITDMM